MKVERIVLDTNVLISAALFAAGKPAACLDWAIRNSAMLASAALLQELETRLARPKFSRYVDESDRQAFLARLGRSAIMVEHPVKLAVCRDPDDDKLLEIAVAGAADCIVTGDQDLLVLNPFANIRVLTPTTFLQILSDENDA